MTTMTIREWAASIGASRGLYYSLRKRGKAPKTIQVGPRFIRITDEAAAQWLLDREADSKSETTK
jgi:predicted DNA-binding transcriptional regulator AlpA